MEVRINEAFLHFIWKFLLFENKLIFTSNKEKLEILSVGTQNHDSGPDFFNARIKIENTLWAGNIEIHINSSDWNLHKHYTDDAYNNVILHVVYNHNEEIFSKNGNKIPTLELKNIIQKNVLEKYNSLVLSEKRIPCSGQISSIKPIIIQNYLSRLAIERLERKTDAVLKLVKKLNNDWNEAFYIYLAKNFGMKVNAAPFEMLATSLPQKIISKHKNNLLQLEALLFGQSGLLENAENTDDYTKSLKKEFVHLKRKYNLQTLPKGIWKFAKIRPNSFPTIKLAQFAFLCHISSHLFSKIIECNSFAKAKKMFNVEASEYWRTHYTFGNKSKSKMANLGETTIQTIFINTIIPFLFAYGRINNNSIVEDKVLSWLEELKPENNSIIKMWNEEGIVAKSAFTTQALLQLKNEYCNQLRCINCGVGVELIK